jgi:ectoine hydroxylase-related dioxygenase (phytanoyl-CoA dioxygenase family)
MLHIHELFFLARHMQLDPVRRPELPACAEADFARTGFIVAENLLGAATCAALNAQLELVLRGECDGAFGCADKAPKFSAERRCKPGKKPPPLGGPSKQTLQVINIWKADATFASVVLSPTLGQLVAQLGGWAAGARVANDQVWAKPPGAAPITFHRDSAYFDFTPSDVITVWLALDDMEPELGPLQYVAGSHKWADGRVGSAQQFFDCRNRFALLHDAARREGIEEPEAALELTTLGVRMGGCGIHNGRLWHGSGQNESPNRPRRGLGIHFVPADAQFTHAMGSTLAHKLRPPEQVNGTVMSEALFPITWRPDHAACRNRGADPCADPSPTTCGGGGGGGGGSGGRVRCLPSAASLLLKVTILAADKVQISVAVKL